MNIPVPDESSMLLVSSRQRSPKSLIASGEVIQEKGRSGTPIHVASMPSDFAMKVSSSGVLIEAVLRNEDALVKVLSSAPLESAAAIWRSKLTSMSWAVTARPPSVGYRSQKRAPWSSVNT